MNAQELRTVKEKRLFSICFILSLIIWIALVFSIVGILYGGIIAFFIFVSHALMIAYLRGHSVKLSAKQLPDLHTKVIEAANKLGLAKMPETYVMQAGGVLNAFATKFIGRNFIIIYSDLIEACDPDGKEIDLIIGHEVGHLALGHLRWLAFLAPARFLPWIGPAYSRACEYSCDRCGLEVVGNINTAARGIAILAAGGKLARKINLNSFVAQSSECCGFWSSIYELNASHPFLSKRIAALINWKKPGSYTIPKRNILAFPLAPFLGFSGVGGGAAPLVFIAVIGIMAAIAIPQFQQYRERANLVASIEKMDDLLQTGQEIATQYYSQNGTWPCSIDELDGTEIVDATQINGWEIEFNCEYNYIGIYYNDNGETKWRALMLETGEIQEGSL